MRTVVIFVYVTCLTVAGVSAQTAAPAPPPPGVPAQPPPLPLAGQVTPAAPAAPVPPSEDYTYTPDGRRDPFLNLLGMGTETRPSGPRLDGAAGLMVAEIAVRGILESRGALIAMIQGPDKKTYIVRQGDKFVDGTIRSVTATGLVIVQEVNDPLSLVKQREINKLLRSQESAKE